MAPSLPLIAGISVASTIGCYLAFPSVVAKTCAKLGGGTLPTPPTFSQRIKLLAKQTHSPTPEVQYYRNIGLFSSAVYLIWTQGHQFTVA